MLVGRLTLVGHNTLIGHYIGRTLYADRTLHVGTPCVSRKLNVGRTLCW